MNKIKIKRILFVEGKDDSFVTSALLNSIPGVRVTTKERYSDKSKKALLEINQTSEVAVDLQIQVLGVNDLLIEFPTAVKGSELDTLAMIIDANADFDGRWKAVRSRLENVGCVNLPTVPPKDGLMLVIPNGPRVGVWIMPDNCGPGMLEDWAILLIPDNDESLPHVLRFVDGIPDAVRKFKNCSKAILRTWLAIQDEPRTIGDTIKEKIFDLNKVHCQLFRSWLQCLLVEMRPDVTTVSEEAIPSIIEDKK